MSDVDPWNITLHYMGKVIWCALCSKWYAYAVYIRPDQIATPTIRSEVALFLKYPLYTNILYNGKTRYNDNLNGINLWLKVKRITEEIKHIVFNILRNIWCGYLLESPHWGASNKYPQHMFLTVNKERKGFLSLIILLYFGILYSGKLFIMAESKQTNAVVITRFFCSTAFPNKYALIQIPKRRGPFEKFSRKRVI